MKHTMIFRWVSGAAIAAMVLLSVCSASATGGEAAADVESELAKSFYSRAAGEFSPPWDGYSGVKKELIDDFCETMRLDIDKESVWCSDKNPSSNTYMLIGSFLREECKYYFSAIYEENGDDVFLYEFQSTLGFLPHPAWAIETTKKMVKDNLVEETKEILMESFPSAEVTTEFCERVVGEGWYTVTIHFNIGEERHSVNTSFEFEGDGMPLFGSVHDFHLFSATVDGENVFNEEKIFKHSANSCGEE